MAKAFLYTGIVFLIMLTVLISTNYFLFSKHSKEESRILVLTVDSVNSLPNDIKTAIAFGGNNTMADAMSDATYSAINASSNRRSISAICSALDPNSSESEGEHGRNISKWIMNYTNITFSNISALPGINVTYNVQNVSAYGLTCQGNQYQRTLTMYLNISYVVKANTSPIYVEKGGELIRYKTLEINKLKEYDIEGVDYRIRVIDYSGRVDFDKTIYCPTPKTCNLS